MSALLAALALVGCSQAQLVHQASEHNSALEWSGNQVILLNAVRASKGYPYYFTVLGDLQGRDMATASADVSPTSGITSFANHQYVSYRGRGQIQLNNGFNQFNVSNANSDDFALSLTQPLNVNQVSVFINSDWSTEHMAMMILRRIGLSERDLGALTENYHTRCKQPRDSEAKLCELIKSALDRCGLPPGDLVREGGGASVGRVYLFNNDPEEPCSFVRFQAMVRSIVLANPTMTPYEDARARQDGARQQSTSTRVAAASGGRAGAAAKGGKTKGDGDQSAAQETAGEQQVINVTVNNASDKEKRPEPRPHLRVEIKTRSGVVQVVYLPTEGARAGVAGTYFLLRSPGDMIDYLGRLIRAQLKSDPGIKPDVLVDHRHLVPFFKIARGGGIERAAVSVVHEGERFYVPPTGYDPGDRHMTMQSLMLINQLLSMKVKRENLRNNSSLFLQ